MMPSTFDLTGPLPSGRTLIEASAGTGKTYSIAALVARFVAGELAGSGRDLTEGVGVDELLVVTYTRAAASELRDRIRDKLRAATDYLDGASLPPGDEWLRAFDAGGRRVRQCRRARLHDAVARLDEATVTTIHGFCQQALLQCGLRSGADGGVELVEDDLELIAEACRDALIDRLVDDPFALSADDAGRPADPLATAAARQPLRPSTIERHLIRAVRAVLGNPGAQRTPHPDAGGLAGAWAAVVDEAVATVGARQRARRQIGYDRLISDLRDLLADPAAGPELAEQLAARYRLVLVDEFQDTDRLQWEVFERAFGGHRLITVGDPKQAIYRFRGADVHAYLRAVSTADRVTLRTNFRSDQQLLGALAVLFNGAELGHPEIAFAHVAAAPLAPGNALGADAAVQFRVVPDDGRIPKTTRGTVESGTVAKVVLTDVASRIRTLLDTATITVGSRTRHVRAADIGVLVPSQRRAAEAAAVLREWGIPSVRARTGSVLLSKAATQWRLLLAGLARPTHARTARAAGLGWFFDVDPAELAGEGVVGDGDDESPLVELQRQLAVLADRLRRQGFGQFYSRLRAESSVLETVLAQPDGDRDVADLDHLAELLGAGLGGTDVDAARIEQLLESMIADANDQAEATMRRIETDDDAVQITTVHSAKGLEYPIVLLPFAYTERPNATRPFVYNGPAGERIVDVASWVQWCDGHPDGSPPATQAAALRKQLATAEVDADGLRLLYVAMTRAKHRLEVWWAPTWRAGTSALGRLLLDRTLAGPLHNSAADSGYQRRTAEAPDQVDALVAASNGTIARFDVALDQPVRRPLPLGERPVPLLTTAGTGGRHPVGDPAWRAWSFTAVTRELAGREAPPAAARPDVGGADEPGAGADGEVPQLGPVASDAASGEAAMALAAIAGGTVFGTMVHDVLERVDFTAPTLAADVAALVDDGARRSGLAFDTSAVARGLLDTVATPLGPMFGDRALGDIPAGDRLAELSFDVCLGDAPLPSRRFGELLADTLEADDPLRPYGVELAAELADVDVAGWLTGSIDAVFRVATGDDPRFVIVDYKSNRLHAAGAADPLAAYRPDALLAAMTHGHYPLQALLYSVALHRYLRWRLGDGYEPGRHLGGIAYLFVRGMVGPGTPLLGDTPYGVFSWRPPAATVLALDSLLTTSELVRP